METALRTVKTIPDERDNTILVQEIREVEKLLSRTDDWFQLECDESLIEACIYEREALHARYRYLLRQARQRGLLVHPFAAK